MSASDKKKLRKEQYGEMLTAKQRQQRADEKKLKLYTVLFVTSMILIVGIVLAVLGIRAVTNGGLVEKMTVAATVGDTDLNTVEFSYYYNDAVSEWYNGWYEQYEDQTDTYLLMMNFDSSKPLDEQIQDEETGKTWADYFVEQALEDAKRDVALCAEAKKAGFELPEESKTQIDTTISNLEMFAPYYGFPDANAYLRAMYGNGADMKNYRKHLETTTMADAYYDAHLAEYEFTAEEMDAYVTDNGKELDYTAFTYTSVYLSYTYFQQGGTEDEDGSITYTDEENNAARAAMQNAADSLLTATTDEEVDAKVAEIQVKEGSAISVSNNEYYLYNQFSGANADLSAWIADEARVEGDKTLIPIEAKVTVNGEETTVINGYYFLLFHARNELREPMGNVRHLLVKFEGGTEDDQGVVVYSDEEKAAAKAEADGYLKQWQEGEATEDTFIALVKEHTDDSSAETGGLYEDIHPYSSYVENFLKWSIDPNREKGDAEVIETEYGYHVMYYVGDDELSYRDVLITGDMAAVEQETWYNGLIEPITATVGDLSKIELGLILNQGQ